MNAIAATVRGTVGMVSDDSVLASPEDLTAWSGRFPAEEFPRLREAASCPADFLGDDFEFGIRALAEGLLARAGADRGPADRGDDPR